MTVPMSRLFRIETMDNAILKLLLKNMKSLFYVQSNDNQALYHSNSFQGFINIFHNFVSNNRDLDYFVIDFLLDGSKKYYQFQKYSIDHFIIYEGNEISDFIEREKRVVASQEIAKIGTWYVDIVNNIPHWSDVTYDIHEVPRGEEVKIDEAINYYIPKHRPIIEQLVQEGIKNNSSWDIELKIQTRTGNIKWIRTIGLPVLDEAGNILRLEGSFQDIDDDKSRRIELESSNALLESIFTSMPDALVFANEDREIVKTSQSFTDLFGYELSEVAGRKTKFLYADSDGFDKKTSGLYSQENSSSDRLDYLMEYKKKNGDIFLSSTSGRPVLTKENNVIGFLGTIRDITKFKSQEREVRELKERLEFTLAGSEIGFWEFDLETESLNWSPTMFDLYGRNPDKFTGKVDFWSQCLVPEDLDFALHEIELAVNGHKKFDTSFRILREDNNKIRHIAAKAIVVATDKGKQRMYGLNWDITEQVELEQSLHLEKVRAQNANRAKSSFLANMSHEIRTPMNGVLGTVSLLRELSLTAEQDDLVSTIETSGDALLSLLNDILDLSKIDSGMLDLSLEQVDLEDLVHRNFNLFKGGIDTSKVDYSLNIALKHKGYLGDGKRINQVLNNLISNAVKFTSQGQILIDVSSIPLDEENDIIRIIVKDTGIGINKIQQKRVFSEFIQADNSIAKEFGGTGLGLSITKKLLRMMNGSIELESQDGEGTIFTVEIPLLKTNLVVGETSSVEFISNDFVKVLIVEDNKINQKLINLMFKKIGIKTDVANNGYMAIDMVSKNNYDAIFMDIQMPGMDGITATQYILKEEKNPPPIIAITANAFSTDKKKCFDAGMSDFLTKPIKIEHIKTVLSKLKGTK